MKVALCISGQPRFYESGYAYIKQYLLDTLNPDVFLHMWFDIKKVGQPYSCASWNNGCSDIVKANTVERMVEIYNPKDYIFEPEKFYDDNLIRNYDSHKGVQSAFITFSQFYSIMMCNELRKQYEFINKFEYDWVIKIRPDWAIESYLQLSSINSDVIYVPNNCPDPNYITDQFAFGNSYNMNVYSSVFPHIDKYWLSGDRLVGETMITRHLKINNIPYKTISIKHNILRKC